MDTESTIEQVAWPHVYAQAIEVTTMKEVKSSFQSGYDPNLNWLFVGVSRLYGTTLNLDQIEAILLDESDYSESINGRYPVNVLIVHPRVSVIKYGEVLVNIEDVEWMRGIVKSTVEAINDSQDRNI